MEVNVVFADKVEIDEKNNFRINFQNEDTIIELLLNRKKDYYLTNAITFLKDEDSVNPKAVKDLEEIAKKHLLIEEEKKFETIFISSLALDFLTNINLFDRWVVPVYRFVYDKSDMEEYKKEYKYFNTAKKQIETFIVYDFLKHFRRGLTFNKSASVSWAKMPIESIIFKLTNNDKNILIQCKHADNQSFRCFMYDWANKLIVYDVVQRKWYSSLNGWVEIFRRILNGLKSITQKELFSILRPAFAQYFLHHPNALIIKHEDNYSKLSEDLKTYAIFLVTKDGHLRVNYTGRIIIYIGSNKLKNNLVQRVI